MRYLLQQAQNAEIKARQEYLYDIFHTYFLPQKVEGNYIELTPIGNKGPDIFFITGHTGQVYHYLKQNLSTIAENTIVITSCLGGRFKEFTKHKNIYTSSIDGQFCNLYDGTRYNFNFDITDAELNFYNASGSIEDKLKASYYVLN